MSKTLIFISVVWYNDGYNLYFCDYWVRKKLKVIGMQLDKPQRE